MLRVAGDALVRASGVRSLASVALKNNIGNLNKNSKRGITYKARVKDSLFVLNEVLNAPARFQKEGFQDVTPDLIEGVLQEIAKFSENVLAPLYEVGDKEGCKLLPNTDVSTPTGWKDAYTQFAEAGWQSVSVPTEYGGQGLPLSLGLIKSEYVGTANWAWGMYPGLSQGAMNTLLLHGTKEMKDKYVTELAAGTLSGTMCLTEPQCGSDLGQVKTKAVPQADGTYKITGTKIFISCGEHNFTENIIHIVLARLPDAPAGTKGISLFLVPKYLEKDGQLDKSKKNVVCGRIENKMGIHGSSTCEMHFEDSVGYLIGKPNTGLYQMFTFMNTARLGTAVQGLSTCELSFQTTLPYARSRLSMRSLSGAKYPDKVADPIIVHGDVRRMLLTMKAFAEGARAMIYDGALIADQMINPDEKVRARVEDNLGLLTPILKGFITEISLESASYGMQIFGGHGFIRENVVEQIYRDARISTLYEGTTGIQSLDLIGRKTLLQKGKPLRKFSAQILKYCSSVLSSPYRSELYKYAIPLSLKVAQWNWLATKILVKAGSNRDIASTSSVDFLMFSGYVTMAYYWLRMAEAAAHGLKTNPSEKDFYQAKLDTCEFYFNRILPRTEGLAKTMTKDPKDHFKLSEDSFFTE